MPNTSTKSLSFTYVNYKNVTSTRTITPKNMWFGSTKYHPEDQWFITGFDLGKGELRDFAINDMIGKSIILPSTNTATLFGEEAKEWHP